MYNSTIKQRVDICPLCSPDKGKQPLIAGKCNYHYWLNSRMKSVAKQQEKEIEREGLNDVIADLDAVYSRYLRLKAADKNGMCECYTCRAKIRWQDSQCSHFISRSHLYLRWDSRNTVVACYNCNVNLYGNIPEYSKRLEQDSAGLVEILQEQARIVYHYTREELKSMIADYTKKVKQLLP